MSAEHDPEVIKSECTLAIARYLQTDPTVVDPFEFACFMFFAGFDVQAGLPRTQAEVEADLLIARQTEPVPFSRPRRVANFGGTHAHDRPRTDPATPARRKGDAADAALAAELEAEARRARDRERQQRAFAHQHPGE